MLGVTFTPGSGSAPAGLGSDKRPGQSFLDLSDLVAEPLRTDEEFILYRGEYPNLAGKPSVLLLAAASTSPALDTLRKLENEYSLRDELDSAWAARPLALSEHLGHMTLVLEDPGGEILDRFLPGPMEMTRFLRFGVGIATALSKLHEKGLIHKDVKPANVLVNPATGQARLMGSGIASRLPRERQAPEPPEFIAGTLYLHGSRTNRANESLDRFAERPLCSRRDAIRDGDRDSPLYCVPIRWNWCTAHIARQPVPPVREARRVFRARSRQSS